MSLHRHERRLLVEATIALACANLLLHIMPFRRIAQWFEKGGSKASQFVSPSQDMVAGEIGWAVETMAGAVPWDSRCLVQALAGWWMLGRRRIGGAMYFGVEREEGKAFSAHAWLRCGARFVTGGEGHEGFAVLATFARGVENPGDMK